LNRFPEHFTAPDFEPFVPVLADGLFCHRWPGPRATLYTLRNLGVPRRDAPLLEVPRAGELECYDLWNGRSLRGEPRGDRWRIFGSLDRLGCIAVCRKDERPPGLSELLHRQRPEAGGEEVRESRLPARAVIEPLAVAPTPRVARDRIPPGMVLVPGGEFRMKIQHRRRECGCYPDPGTPPDRWPEFLRGTPHDGTLEHHIGPRTLAPFFIDAAEVSNAEYQRFLEVSGYRPQHPENFLAHWPGGKLPAELADHPVVYVDLDDARAYARWAGKRLPTEAEWQRAAQGPDGRRWPWGDEFAADRCHSSGRHTMPVRSLPEGRSPSGCYHLAGNVWEWTESERDDGHTRFVMLRGGSYFRAEGSIWYADGGAQPCDHHAKFIRMWPGLDRCATIGFRCVVDAQ
jgi:formylglycine-generating enzyme required for sulfatase activity